tara:strand:- start:1350 stop:3269 length:1920 start_codon:yes stop_codon:yes gene_type:complete
MAKLLKLRRGTTTQHSSFTGAEGEVTVDTDKETLVVHDGSTAGGHPVAAEDLANVSSSTIAGRLSNDSIAVSKIAAGTLPSDVKIQDANVSGNLTIARADIVDGEVINSKLDSNAVTTAKINDGAVTTAKIAGDAINGSKIADNAINSEHYTDGSIDRVHLAADIVNGTKIADDSINSEHYVDGSIDTAHIANNAVTTGKLQTIITDTFLGRTTGGTGNVEVLSAASARGILNVENGATADQTASEILTLIKTVDGAGSGLNADQLDGVSSAGFVRGDGTDNGATTIKADNADFIIQDSTDATTNFIWRDHSANVLYLGTGNAVVTPRSNVVPQADSTFNLGANGTRWSNIYGDQLYGAGGNITALNASNLSSGTVPQARLSASTLLTLIKTVDGSGSGLDADTLDGMNASSGTGANTIVQRNASGYVFANYFNTSPNDVTSGVTKVCVETGNDGYIRHGSAAAIRSFINVENGATADQTGSEIANALGAQNIYTTANIGRDGNDYLKFTNDSRLDVYIAGNNEFRFESDGDFHADGDVYAYSSTTASDENLKKDVVTVADAVTKVEALKGVTFKWKKNDVESAGVIAQDVEKVLPQVVKTVADTDGTEFKAVNYGGLTSLLIEAVKDLSARIKVLEAK